jgi:pyruvate,water dikinase
MKSKLYLLGVLVAYSRQLDVQMGSETHISMYVDQFKNLMQSNLT